MQDGRLKQAVAKNISESFFMMRNYSSKKGFVNKIRQMKWTDAATPHGADTHQGANIPTSQNVTTNGTVKTSMTTISMMEMPRQLFGRMIFFSGGVFMAFGLVVQTGFWARQSRGRNSCGRSGMRRGTGRGEGGVSWLDEGLEFINSSFCKHTAPVTVFGG